MKLSEVSRANELVRNRRELVTAFVDIGRATDIGSGFGSSSPFHTRLCLYSLYGYQVDDLMAEAVGRAMRAEIRARIATVDEELAGLGVEVDGIEVTIAREESMEQPKAVLEEAA